jgi:ubiquinone/menaquinone biosynthesis C-methylase UbiE
MTVVNPFTQEQEAQRYDSYRPAYHDLPFQKLYGYLGRTFHKSLDICCGTGHSTQALMKMSRNVVACDMSASMLAVARKRLPVTFVEARAEKLPFAKDEFDFLNISMAFQWLDQQSFLQEAKRVLIDKGYLNIDNYGFTGNMLGSEGFKQKYQDFDKNHFPPAKRNNDYPEQSFMSEFGFSLLTEISYSHEVFMNPQQFTNYLMTRSNFQILGASEQSRTSGLLLDYYKPLFSGMSQALVFSGTLKLYQITKQE